MKMLVDPKTGKLLYFAPPDLRICLRFLCFHWWRTQGRFIALNDADAIIGLREYARYMMRGKIGWKKWLLKGITSDQLWVHHNVFLNHFHIRDSFDKFCIMTSAYTDMDPSQWPEPTVEAYEAAEQRLVIRPVEMPMKSMASTQPATSTAGKARASASASKKSKNRPKQPSSSAISLIKSNMSR